MTTLIEPVKPITLEDLLDQPDNGLERWIINGELKEAPMTRRNRFHSSTMSRVATALTLWLYSQKSPAGDVLTGDCAFRLQSDPETSVGADLAYVSAEMLA